MEPPILLLPSALSELFAQSSSSGRLTVADRYGLLAALLDDSLNGEERASIDRLLRLVRRGKVVIVEDVANSCFIYR